jgi:GT2 family glycosyltransferase
VTAAPAQTREEATRDMPASAAVAAVVIGRNEAPRLRPCLSALIGRVAEIVYVDSGSTDGSPEIARQLGVTVVRLESGPYTAARGRDAGMAELLSRRPDLEFIQFVDGDCVIDPGWIEAGVDSLRRQREIGVVAGRLREQHAASSLLIRIVDADWDLPTGRTDAVGGIFLARVEALRQAGGWRSDLIAGEELDLSARLIDRGWHLQRIPVEMTLHDIGIRSARELWRRAIRTGHAYAELATLHGRRYARWRRRTASNLGYGLALPGFIILAVILWWPAAIALTLIYAVLAARLARWRVKRGDPLQVALAYGLATALCKIASGLGAARFFIGRALRRPSRLMEYKTAAPPAGGAP